MLIQAGHLKDRAALDRLDPTKAPNLYAPIMETVRRVRSGLASEGFDTTALIGFAGAPFTVACYMVEGGGSRDFAATRAMAYADPALFDGLMDLLTDSTIGYLSAQADAGAEALMLFDSWAGVLSPSLFRKHVIGPAKRIVEALKRRHPAVPIIGFPRLAGPMLGEYAATGVNAVAIDTSVDLTRATTSLPTVSCSSLTERVVITDVTTRPPAVWTSTSDTTGPSMISLIVPRNWLRTLMAVMLMRGLP